MKTRSMMFYVVALIIALGMSQSVMAKKITYLGHYYNGKVNKQKIPEGEGGIAIADVAVFGTFSANNITNVKIETDWINISGEISFDESDRITVKAGSNISSRVYLSSSIKDIRRETDLKPEGNRWIVSHVFEKTLEKDSIVDLASTHADFYVPTIVRELAPNPPTIMSQVHAELVPIEISYDVMDIWGKNTGQTAKRQTKIFKIEKNLKEIEYRLDNYKDKFGRIWNVFRHPKYLKNCVGKVTYPDGSYIETNEDGNIKDFEIKNENGFVIKENLVIFPDSVKIKFSSGFDRDKQFRNYISKPKVYDAYLSRIIFPQSQISKLSKKEIITLINEKISQAFVNYKFIYESKYNLDVYEGGESYDNRVGIYNEEKGEYVSYKELDAEKDARDAARNKSIANFKKKYGFDPSVDNARYVVKPGRNLIGVVDERNAWIVKYHKELDRYGNTGIITIKPDIDQGSRKCFQFAYNGYFCGYIWVSNSIITSVIWK